MNGVCSLFNRLCRLCLIVAKFAHFIINDTSSSFDNFSLHEFTSIFRFLTSLLSFSISNTKTNYFLTLTHVNFKININKCYFQAESENVKYNNFTHRLYLEIEGLVNPKQTLVPCPIKQIALHSSLAGDSTFK